MTNHYENFYIAQAAPTEGKIIRRTIEVEDAPEQTPAPDDQASSSVIYGMGIILLVLVAIAGIAIFWRNYQEKK